MTSLRLALKQSLDNLQLAQNQLVESEKMASLGGLVAGVAHEINTPLSVGMTAASLLADKTSGIIKCYDDNEMKRSDLEKFFKVASETTSMVLTNLDRTA